MATLQELLSPQRAFNKTPVSAPYNPRIQLGVSSQPTQPAQPTLPYQGTVKSQPLTSTRDDFNVRVNKAMQFMLSQ